MGRMGMGWSVYWYLTSDG